MEGEGVKSKKKREGEQGNVRFLYLYELKRRRGL